MCIWWANQNEVKTRFNTPNALSSFVLDVFLFSSFIASFVIKSGENSFINGRCCCFHHHFHIGTYSSIARFFFNALKFKRDNKSWTWLWLHFCSLLCQGWQFHLATQQMIRDCFSQPQLWIIYIVYIVTQMDFRADIQKHVFTHLHKQQIEKNKEER